VLSIRPKMRIVQIRRCESKARVSVKQNKRSYCHVFKKW